MRLRKGRKKYAKFWKTMHVRAYLGKRLNLKLPPVHRLNSECLCDSVSFIFESRNCALEKQIMYDSRPE